MKIHWLIIFLIAKIKENEKQKVKNEMREVNQTILTLHNSNFDNNTNPDNEKDINRRAVLTENMLLKQLVAKFKQNKKCGFDKNDQYHENLQSSIPILC